MPDRRPVTPLGLLLVLLGSVGLLHVVHVAGGHRWFSVFGPLVALAATVVVAVWSWPAAGSAGLGIWASLLALLVFPEWVEGELSAGHALTWGTIETHGRSTLAVLSLAVGAGVLWEAARLVALIRPR